VNLAEAGCSEREIMAITGHQTSQMVDHYVKAANQKNMAKAAIEKLKRTPDC
jgi:integrase